MHSISHFIECLEQVVKDPSVSLPQALFAINLLDEGGSIVTSYLLDGRNRTVHTRSGADASTPSDCSLGATEANFLQFSKVESSRLSLIMSGKIKLDGNKKLLRELAPCFEALKRKMPIYVATSARSQWVKDEVALACAQCHASFGFFNRRHHCRKCGGVFCSRCTSKRIEQERVCEACFANEIAPPSKPESVGTSGLLQAVFTRQLEAHRAERVTLTNPPQPHLVGDWRMLGLTRKVAQLEDLLERQSKKGDFTIKWVLLLASLILLQPTMQHFDILSVLHVFSVFFDLVLSSCNNAVLALQDWSFGLSSVWVLLVAWVIYIFVFSRNFLLRRMIIYSIAIRIIAGYVFVKYWCKLWRYSEERTNDMYESAHQSYAPLLYRTIVNLQGFWIKVGQYLSSRADVIPETWTKELKKLQDCVPFDNMEVVGKIIQEELNDSVCNLFATFNSTPLAAASIAQVHEAQLKDGRRVVVKVKQMRGEAFMLAECEIMCVYIVFFVCMYLFCRFNIPMLAA